MADGLIGSFTASAGKSFVFEFDIEGHTTVGYLVVMGASSKFFWSKEAALNFAEEVSESGWDDGTASPPVVIR